MSSSNVLRLGALAGIAYVVLQMVGLIAGNLASTAPFSIFPSTSQAARIAATATPQGVWIGLGLAVLSVPFFVVFAVRLWIALRGAAADVSLLPTTALIAAGVAATLSLASFAVAAALDASAGHGLDSQGAMILSYLSSTMDMSNWPVLGLFLIAAGVAGVRERSLPAWTAWAALPVGVATAVADLAATSDLAQMVQLLPLLWIIATSIALVARPGRAAQSSKVMIGA